MKDTTLVLSACCLAMLSVGDNSTAVMAALPAMTRELRLDSAAVEWVVNAYLLAAAAFILLGGEAADRFGSRRSSTAGIALFAFSSLIITLAPSASVVIGARALQGLGGAFAVAGTLAAATETPESERAGAIAAWTGFLMLGFSIGPLVGGAVTHYAGWRFNFALNLVAIVPAAIMLAIRPGPPGRKADTLDWLGVCLLAVFMVSLILALRSLPDIRVLPLATIVPGASAIVAFAALIFAERRHPRPLLDFNFLAKANLVVACEMAFVLMFGIMTLLLYYNLYAQAPKGLGMSAIAAGVSLLPLSIALFGFARAAPRLSASVGLRRMLLSGWLLFALGCLVLWASLAEAPPALRCVGLFAIGAGIALPYASAPRIALATLPPTQSGKGSGLVNTCSFLGGTVGVTCGGIVFAFFGFPGVVILLGLLALLGAGLALRVRP
jgi:MFS family permease